MLSNSKPYANEGNDYIILSTLKLKRPGGAATSWREFPFLIILEFYQMLP